jgi:hypothetical protein
VTLKIINTVIKRWKSWAMFMFYHYRRHTFVLWRICLLLSNGSVNIFPKHTLSTVGHPLLGNGPINTHLDNRRRCFPWGPFRGIIGEHSRKNWRSTTEFSWSVHSEVNEMSQTASCQESDQDWVSPRKKGSAEDLLWVIAIYCDYEWLYKEWSINQITNPIISRNPVL